MKGVLRMNVRKGAAILLSGVMMCGATCLPQLSRFINSNVMTAHAISTADEAIEWVKAQKGKSIDMDGAPPEQPYQCVDLIKAYYNYLGVPVIRGDGKDFATNDLPDSNWVRIKDAVPQKGDILVYSGNTGNPAGHVAIYESEYSTFHQNYSKHPFVENITGIRYNGFFNPYWGVIRPNFNSRIIGPEM